MAVLNLTTDDATEFQTYNEVVDLPDDAKSELSELLTFENSPSSFELQSRAEQIADIALEYRFISSNAMIAGLPALMRPLEMALEARGITPQYSFSERVSVDRQNPDVSVTTTSIFEHRNFVDVPNSLERVFSEREPGHIDNPKEGILNLTQDNATPDQVAAGVVEPENKQELQELLTFEEIPLIDYNEIEERAYAIADIAEQEGYDKVMIGGESYLMSALENALESKGITPMYAYSERISTPVVQEDGSVKNQVESRFEGFIVPSEGVEKTYNFKNGDLESRVVSDGNGNAISFEYQRRNEENPYDTIEKTTTSPDNSFTVVSLIDPEYGEVEVYDCTEISNEKIVYGNTYLNEISTLKYEEGKNNVIEKITTMNKTTIRSYDNQAYHIEKHFTRIENGELKETSVSYKVSPYNEEAQIDIKREYDIKGNEIKTSVYVNGEYAGAIEREYDRNGEIMDVQLNLDGVEREDETADSISLDVLNNPDEKEGYTEYTLYKDSSMSIRYYDTCHQIEFKEVYDKEGYIKEDKEYNDQGDVVSQKEYVYDKDSHGLEYSKITSFDKESNVEKATYYDKNGAPMEIHEEDDEKNDIESSEINIESYDEEDDSIDKMESW